MHHAFLVVGSQTEALGVIPKDVHTPGIDVQHMSFDRFGIDDARTLSLEASRRPIAGEYRTFLLVIGSATHEAQNALLKTLEEPAVTARFYIVVPREDVLIPTVRSRLMSLEVEHIGGYVTNDAATQFIKSDIADRLGEIAKRTKEKDEAWVQSVLSGLEIWAVAHSHRSLMEDIIMVRGYIEAPGASKKMLLEHIALTLPS